MHTMVDMHLIAVLSILVLEMVMLSVWAHHSTALSTVAVNELV